MRDRRPALARAVPGLVEETASLPNRYSRPYIKSMSDVAVGGPLTVEPVEAEVIEPPLAKRRGRSSDGTKSFDRRPKRQRDRHHPTCRAGPIVGHKLDAR
jgi:hypothetical protein